MKRKGVIRTSIFFLLFVGIICAGLSCYSGNLSKRNIKNVLLISIDTCRADYLGCYGYSHQTTPHIDKLAEESFLFTNAYSTAPITLPAHCSMLTGIIPPAHGVRDNSNYKVAKHITTIAEILKENGFSTAGFVSCYIMDSIFGLDQGFDIYNDDFEEKHETMGTHERRGEDTSRLALEWLDRHKTDRFFLFLHYYDPHSKYDPPEPFATEFKDNLYAGEISYVDYCIGQVINTLKVQGLYDQTLIIVTADHGEMLGEHGESTHAYFIYQANVRVPLIIRVPGQNTAGKFDCPVNLIDILPTICDMLDIEPPDSVQGMDLSDQFSKNLESGPERYLYCESLTPTKYNANSLLGVITDRWKYIQTTRPELYDLTRDPGEITNLAQKEPQIARALQDQLKQILEASTPKQGRGKDTSMALLGKEGRSRLESLGYIASSVVSEDVAFDQIKEDPKDLIQFHVSAMWVTRLIYQEMYTEAKALCEKMLVERPDLTSYSNLAHIAMIQKDYAGAFHYLSEATNLYNNSELSPWLKANLAPVYSSLGTLLINQKKFEDAVPYLRKALHLNPNLLDAQYYLGNALEYQRDYPEAEKEYSQSLQIKPDYSQALYRMGVVQLEQQKFDKAADAFLRLLKIEPENIEAHYNLGVVLQQQGRIDDAIVHFSEILRLDPNNEKALNNLGTAYFSTGKMEEAIVQFYKILKTDPGYEKAHDNLGAALAMEQRFGEAVVHFREALRLNPEIKTTQINLERAQKELERIDLTISLLEKHKSMPPGDPDLYCRLGDLYIKKGDFKEAVNHYRTALEIRPGLEKAEVELRKVELITKSLKN